MQLKSNCLRARCAGAIAIIALLSFPAVAARADVRLPHLFSDNMVLQQGKPLPVWGTAQPGEKVTVKISGKEGSATADDKGKWSVKLDALAATDKALEMSVSGK